MNEVAGGAVPFEGFDLVVLVDRPSYRAGEVVRISVTATNHADRYVEHRFPGWQRFVLSVRDEAGRSVADDTVDRVASEPAVDRWLPGQVVVWPTWWHQRAGAIVPGRAGPSDAPRVPAGRYRVRATWLGREPGDRTALADALGPWFDLV